MRKRETQWNSYLFVYTGPCVGINLAIFKDERVSELLPHIVEDFHKMS